MGVLIVAIADPTPRRFGHGSKYRRTYDARVHTFDKTYLNVGPQVNPQVAFHGLASDGAGRLFLFGGSTSPGESSMSHACRHANAACKYAFS